MSGTRSASGAPGAARSEAQPSEAGWARPPAPGTQKTGFTLLELLLVISLMALIAGVYLGGFTGVLPYEIRTATRVLGSELEYASQRAATTGELHRFVIDLDAQQFRLARLVVREVSGAPEEATHADLLDLRPPRPDREFAPVDNRYGEWRWLDEGNVRVEVVQLAAPAFSTCATGVMFAADGGAESAEILLQDAAGRRMLLRVIAFSGEVRSEELPDA